MMRHQQAVWPKVLVVALLIGGLSVAAGDGASVAAPVGSGSVSGSVVDSGGLPLSGICVNVAGVGGSQTDASGSYAITVVPAGSHTVQYWDCSVAPQFVTQWYLGRADSSTADPVQVTDGTDTVLVDVVMQPGVIVTGTVTDGSLPVAGINVNVNPLGAGPSSGAQTAADGSYRTPPLPDGDYRVQFSDSSATPAWATQYWNQQLSWDTATVLSLRTVDGPVRTGIGAMLAAGAAVSGTVSGDGGQAVGGICVSANRSGMNGFVQIGWATTDAAGEYTMAGLPATGVRIQFRDCNITPTYVEGWYGGTSFDTATPITLTAGAIATGIDVQLVAGIRITGTILDASDNPLAGINVYVNQNDGGAIGYGQSGADGTYTTSPLPAGDYRVQFNAPTSAWATQYWNRQPTWNRANLITLTAGETTHGGIDARLTSASSVGGTVTAPDGSPAADICVSAFIDTVDGPDQVASTRTGTDGGYTIGGLPPGVFKVAFDDCNRVGPYIQQWWQARSDYDSADSITLAAGQQQTGIDAHLVAAAVISGTVTDATATPLAGICVQATTTTFVGGLTQTGQDGTYTLDLARGGDYRVQFVDCSGTPRFTGEFWNDQPDPSTATTVTVTAGLNTSGIDAALAPGAVATLSGSVTNSDGAAVTNACVVAYLPTQFALFAPVQPDGTYTIENIPSGTYALGFLGCTDGQPGPTIDDPTTPGVVYTAVWWNNVPLSLAGTSNGGPDPIAQHANLVTIAPGAALIGYDHCFGCPPPSPPVPVTDPTPPPTTPTATPPGDALVPTTARRLFDSREGAGEQAAGMIRVIHVDGLPADATTVALNVTVTNPQRAGYVTVYPCGSPQPDTSNLNYAAGQTIANTALTQLGPDHTVCVYTNATTDLIIDLDGIYSPTGTQRLNPTTARRLFDSRDGTGEQAAGTVRAVHIDGLPADATTVALNVTVTNPQRSGYVTVYPCGTPQPDTSNLNYTAGQTIANAALTQLGPDHTVCVYTNATTDLIIDLDGVYSPTGTQRLNPTTARRLFDSRDGGGELAAGTVRAVHIDGLPSDASAVALNVTVTNPQRSGYVTVYPCGTPQPDTSDLNYTTGQTIANTALTQLGPNHTICIYTHTTTDLILDLDSIFATYTPPPNSGA